MRQFTESSFKRGTGCLGFVLLLALSFLKPCVLDLQAAYAQEAAAPKIEIAHSSHNFGEVAEGEKIQHEFTVLNKGTAELLIQRVIAGCGCTAAAALNQAIAPNTESKISVTLDTSGLVGTQNKSVRIFSNDTSNPISTVTLSGTVVQKVSAEPANIVFENVLRGDTSGSSREVTVKTAAGSAVKIGQIESFSKNIKIENISGDSSSKKFTVKLDGTLPLGDFRERVIVNLEGDTKGSLNIPVYANIKGSLVVDPPAVSFGLISGKEIINREITVENNSELPYTLLSVESTSKAVTAKVKEIKAGKKYQIQVLLDPARLDTDLRSELRFEADTEMEETIAVNVYGVFPPKL